MVEQHLEIAVIKLSRLSRPSTFEAASHGIATDATGLMIIPAETLFVQFGRFWLWTKVFGTAITVALAHCVTTSCEGSCLFIVHGHSGKGLPDVGGGFERVRLAVDALRVDVDEPHLHSRERVIHCLRLFHIAITHITGGKPLLLGSPIRIFFRVPNIGTTITKAKGFQPHRLIGHVTG